MNWDPSAFVEAERIGLRWIDMGRLLSSLVLFSVMGVVSPLSLFAADPSVALRAKYGSPVSQTFRVRPSIGATATYDANGQIIQWVISPLNTDMIKSRGLALTKESADSVLEEIVPTSVRGKHVSSGVLNVTCMPDNDCWGSEQVFEHVTIYYNGETSRPKYVVVQWRKGRTHQ